MVFAVRKMQLVFCYLCTYFTMKGSPACDEVRPWTASCPVPAGRWSVISPQMDPVRPPKSRPVVTSLSLSGPSSTWGNGCHAPSAAPDPQLSGSALSGGHGCLLWAGWAGRGPQVGPCSLDSRPGCLLGGLLQKRGSVKMWTRWFCAS